MLENKQITDVTGTSGKLQFEHLPEYARFLLQHKTAGFTEEMMRLSREMKLPLLDFFKGMPTEERREIALRIISIFLTCLSENKAEEFIEMLMGDRASNGFPVIRREHIGTEDVIIVSLIAKKCFLKFLPEFTTEQSENNRVIAETDEFFSRLELASYHTGSRGRDAREQQRAEEKFRDLLDSAPDAMVIVNEKGNIELINRQTEKLFGYPREQLIGKPVELLIPHDFRNRHEQHRKNYSNEPHVRPMGAGLELFGLKQDKTKFPVEISLSPLHTEKGTLISAAIRDISEKKRVETELNNSKRELETLYKKLELSYEELENSYAELVRARKRLAENRTRFLINTMPHIVASATPDGALDYANRHLMDFTGLTFDELKGWGWANCIYSADIERLTIAWRHSLETGKPLQMEFRLVNSAGVPVWHFAKVIPHSDEKGEITVWIATITDIHEHKLSEEKKDDFIGIASHELKTPLTSAKAYIQLLENQLSENGSPEAFLYVKRANASIERLNELISDLLDISKIQHGKLAYTFSEFDFNGMVDETIEYVRQTSPRHAIIKTGTACPLITGDKERLRQVCINLLTNAVKYSPNAMRIDVNIQSDAHKITVSVTDYGIGIPESDLEKVFERYYRVKNAGAYYQGMGIGLYISAEIIHRHHGEIWATSKLGEGSTFYFNLPLKPDNP